MSNRVWSCEASGIEELRSRCCRVPEVCYPGPQPLRAGLFTEVLDHAAKKGIDIEPFLADRGVTNIDVNVSAIDANISVIDVDVTTIDMKVDVIDVKGANIDVCVTIDDMKLVIADVKRAFPAV